MPDVTAARGSRQQFIVMLCVERRRLPTSSLTQFHKFLVAVRSGTLGRCFHKSDSIILNHSFQNCHLLGPLHPLESSSLAYFQIFAKLARVNIINTFLTKLRKTLNFLT